jgi:predicted phosphodiesterase
VRLLLIADTHVPKRARDLPAAVWDEVSRADVVIHAGDWVDVSLLDAIEGRARRLVACWGNNDGPELRARLYPDTDVLVFGHSHIPWDTTADTGLRLLNPGSPTDRRRQPFCTYMTATVADAALTEVTLHHV